MLGPTSEPLFYEITLGHWEIRRPQQQMLNFARSASLKNNWIGVAYLHLPDKHKSVLSKHGRDFVIWKTHERFVEHTICQSIMRSCGGLLPEWDIARA